MTRPDRTEPALRQALEDSVAHLPYPAGLVEGMHARAARIRRRRTVAGAAAATVLTASVAGAAVWWGGPAAPPDARPAATSSPAPRPPVAPRPSGDPTGPGTPAGPAPSGGPATRTPGTTGREPSRTPPSSAASTPAAGSGRGRLMVDDTFSRGPLDRGLWTPYVGSSPPVTDWTPDAVTVSGGALRIAVRPVLPRVEAGGVKSVDEHLTGRWEVRWRMGAGGGAIAQLDLLGDGPDGVSHAATLDPSRGTLSVQDLVHGTETRVRVDGRAYHSLAVELAPGGVRWLLDGVVVDDRPGTAPQRPLRLALQAFVSEPACAAQPPAQGCPGPSVAGAVLEVDRVRFSSGRS